MNKMWIEKPRKSCTILLAVLLLFVTARGQYYYKDLVVTQQISSNFQLLKASKVSKVTVTPYDRNAPVTEEVILEQTLDLVRNSMVTYTKTPDAGESWLIAVFNASGLLTATTDSSIDVITHTNYTYDGSGKTVQISSVSTPRDNPAETEVHQWSYNSNGKPTGMIKIKGTNDTTFVRFDTDEQGNIAEEKVTHLGGNLGSTYFYYDSQGRLTDIARFNKRANRILPDYMFAYNESGKLTQMIVVPEGTSDYQTWKYYYNAQGIKQQDLCFNKQKEMVGKIDYKYQYNK